MHGSFLTFDRHQVVNGHQSEAKIEFAEFLFFVSLWMMGFVSGKTLPRNLHVLFTVFGCCC